MTKRKFKEGDYVTFNEATTKRYVEAGLYYAGKVGKVVEFVGQEYKLKFEGREYWWEYSKNLIKVDPYTDEGVEEML